MSKRQSTFAFVSLAVLAAGLLAAGCEKKRSIRPQVEPIRPSPVIPLAPTPPSQATSATETKKPTSKPAYSSERWEKDIAAYEAKDLKSPPPTGEIVFVGSSSIRMWDTKKYFPDLKTIQRGFGGSRMIDSVAFCDRIVTKYRPKIVVVYAGDNDIAGGVTPEQVCKDYQAFVAKVHATCPAAKIIYVPIKPSLARWKLVGKMREANALIEKWSKGQKLLAYLDIDKPMIGPDGTPRKELFMADGLHLNHEGYVLWSSLLRPMLTTPASNPA